MNNHRILKFISGLLVGLGTGVCFGTATDNLPAGLLLGAGTGLCYALAFGAFKKE